MSVLLPSQAPLRRAFSQSVAILRKHFAVKQPENWEPIFASFGDDLRFPMPIAVQLVVKNSEADFFLFIHDYFISHPAVLADFNRVKVEYAERDPEEYWAAKHRVLAPIVSLYGKRANKAPEPTPVSVTPHASS